MQVSQNFHIEMVNMNFSPPPRLRNLKGNWHRKFPTLSQEIDQEGDTLFVVSIQSLNQKLNIDKWNWIKI